MHANDEINNDKNGNNNIYDIFNRYNITMILNDNDNEYRGWKSK